MTTNDPPQPSVPMFANFCRSLCGAPDIDPLISPEEKQEIINDRDDSVGKKNDTLVYNGDEYDNDNESKANDNMESPGPLSDMSNSNHKPTQTTVVHTDVEEDDVAMHIAVTSPKVRSPSSLLNAQTVLVHESVNEEVDDDALKLHPGYGSDDPGSSLSDGADDDYLSDTTFNKLATGGRRADLKSIHSYPTRKIKFPVVMAQHILKNDTFKEIRTDMEEKIMDKIDEIDNVFYNGKQQCWLIQGPNARKLEEHRDLFNIVIWRVPVIPAFATFSNVDELYTEIFEDDEELDDDMFCICFVTLYVH